MARNRTKKITETKRRYEIIFISLRTFLKMTGMRKKASTNTQN